MPAEVVTTPPRAPTSRTRSSTGSKQSRTARCHVRRRRDSPCGASPPRPPATLSPARLSPDATRLVGPHRDLDPVPGTELAHQGADVGLHRAQADVQLRGDLVVGTAAGDGDEHVLLALGQRRDRLGRRGRSLQRRQRGQQPAGDVGRDEGVAVRGRLDRLDQQRGARVLQQEPPGAGLEGAEDVLVEVEGGDDDDRDRVRDAGAGQLAGGLHAVDAGHPDVEEADVGAQLAGDGHRLVPVRGLADDLDPGWASRIIVSPVRTRSWSSATTTRIVTGDASRGSVAETVQPPAGSGPASQVPPSSLARSAMPEQPVARGCSGAGRLAVVVHTQPYDVGVARTCTETAWRRPRAGSRWSPPPGRSGRPPPQRLRQAVEDPSAAPDTSGLIRASSSSSPTPRCGA